MAGSACEDEVATEVLPGLLRWTTRYEWKGAVVEVDHVWTSTTRWRRANDSLAADWCVRDVGPFVLASRLRV